MIAVDERKYSKFGNHWMITRNEVEGAQEIRPEQYAKLKWKVARDFCRYN